MIERLWQGAAIVVVGQTDLDDLEKRLEAVEKALRRIVDNGWLIGAPTSVVQEAVAALAGEES